MLRAMLEQSSHRLVIRRKLPDPFSRARIYASTEGGLRYLRPRAKGIDPILLGLAAELIGPGQTVWDIGANVGLFSFAAAAAAGPDGFVLAVEPDARLVSLLRRSAAANAGLAPVDVLGTAVADQVGVARFHVARRNRSTNHLDGYGYAGAGGTRSLEVVPTVTLDWLAEQFPLPDVIKIDVEEAEMLVLSGGHRVLAHGPSVICEVSGSNSEPARDLLRQHGYELYDGDEQRTLREPLTAAPPNTLAVHPSRRDRSLAGSR
jgi:FkbM family methyltransferase